MGKATRGSAPASSQAHTLAQVSAHSGCSKVEPRPLPPAWLSASGPAPPWPLMHEGQCQGQGGCADGTHGKAELSGKAQRAWAAAQPARYEGRAQARASTGEGALGGGEEALTALGAKPLPRRIRSGSPGPPGRMEPLMGVGPRRQGLWGRSSLKAGEQPGHGGPRCIPEPAAYRAAALRGGADVTGTRQAFRGAGSSGPRREAWGPQVAGDPGSEPQAQVRTSAAPPWDHRGQKERGFHRRGPGQGHSAARPGLSPLAPCHPAGLVASAYSVALNPPGSFLEGVARTGRYTFTAGEPAGGRLPPLRSLLGPARPSRPSGPLTSPAPPSAPAAAVGAIFGITSCVSAQVREKPDDPVNYLLGGCAGGLTLGARSE